MKELGMILQRSRVKREKRLKKLTYKSTTERINDRNKAVEKELQND